MLSAALKALLAGTLVLWGCPARSQVPDSSTELRVNITTLRTSGEWVEVCDRHLAQARMMQSDVASVQDLILAHMAHSRRDTCAHAPLQVSWTGVPSPSIYDAVALVVPADAEANHTAPIKHKWCTESATHLVNGSGSLRCGHTTCICFF
jgi:hypothetical protein